MLYTIHDNAESPPRETVDAANVAARINELSGRSIAGYLLGGRGPLYRNGSAYVAGRGQRAGFVVRKAGA